MLFGGRSRWATRGIKALWFLHFSKTRLSVDGTVLHSLFDTPQRLSSACRSLHPLHAPRIVQITAALRSHRASRTFRSPPCVVVAVLFHLPIMMHRAQRCAPNDDATNKILRKGPDALTGTNGRATADSKLRWSNNVYLAGKSFRKWMRPADREDVGDELHSAANPNLSRMMIDEGQPHVELAFGQICFAATERDMQWLLRGVCGVEPIEVRPHIFHRSHGRPGKSKGLWFVTVAAADAPRCLELSHRLLFGAHTVYEFPDAAAGRTVIKVRDALCQGCKAPGLVDIAVARTAAAAAALHEAGHDTAATDNSDAAAAQTSATTFPTTAFVSPLAAAMLTKRA